jgi:hypothetical protein
MGDERLLRAVVESMRGCGPMTAREIARVASRRGHRRVGRRSVEKILKHNSLMFELHSHRHLLSAARWRLVDAGHAGGPDITGAPVPAIPRPPMLSGAAAVPLTFREDEPPANAIGKLA